MRALTRTGRDAANARAAKWQASELRYLDRSREAHRQAWRAFHLRQAAAILANALALAEKHRAAAEALAKEDQEDDG